MITLKEHLRQRNYFTSLYSQTWIDEEERVILFPLWNLSGQLQGYQQYRPDETTKRLNNPKESRYFTRVPRYKTGMFGMETISDKPYIFVVEGVFDSCPIHVFKEPAVALLSYDNKQGIQNLRLTGKKLIGISDGDKAGIHMAKLCDESIILPDGLDLGNFDLYFVADLLRKLYFE